MSPEHSRSNQTGPHVVVGEGLVVQDSLIPAHAFVLHTAQPSQHPVDYRMYVVIGRAGYVGIVAHAAFVPLFAATGVTLLAVFNVFSVVAWVLAVRLNRTYRQRAAVFLLLGEVVAHAVVATALLGWDIGFYAYLIPLIPFLLFNDRLSTAFVVGGSTAILGVMIVLRFLYRDLSVPLEPLIMEVFTIGNIVVPTATLGLITYYYRRASVSAEGRLERMASHDALTSLLNRRAMRERIAEEHQRVQRGGAPFALVLADIDHFKRINDNYGHDVGDDVLVEMSRVLKAGLRQQDVVARWGGEEYLMMLPGTDVANAVTVTERLRRAIQERTFACGEAAVCITMTFGITQVTMGASIEQSIRDADDALYRGKTGGRNRVVRHGQAA